MEIRQLTHADAGAFQALRLTALRDSPTTFASSYEEERELPLERVAERIAPGNGQFVLGAFDGAELAGCIGLKRMSHLKQAHKAYIWGMYDEAMGFRTFGVEPDALLINGNLQSDTHMVRFLEPGQG